MGWIDRGINNKERKQETQRETEMGREKKRDHLAYVSYSVQRAVLDSSGLAPRAGWYEVAGDLDLLQIERER
jgi:hypothetical protein